MSTLNKEYLLLCYLFSKRKCLVLSKLHAMLGNYVSLYRNGYVQIFLTFGIKLSKWLASCPDCFTHGEEAPLCKLGGRLDGFRDRLDIAVKREFSLRLTSNSNNQVRKPKVYLLIS
jgi:hypothetical protein